MGGWKADCEKARPILNFAVVCTVEPSEEKHLIISGEAIRKKWGVCGMFALERWRGMPSYPEVIVQAKNGELSP